MRAFHAIGAAVLMAFAIPVAGHADGTPPMSSVSQPQAPGCHCPRLQRHVRYHARYWTHRRPIPLVAVRPWPVYNPPIPSPDDSAYDRVMVQYMHAREWGGEYLYEPPYLPRPPVPGLPHFRVAVDGGVFEYDVMAGGYVQLAQRDAPRASVAPTP
jgi:hypothetical protein